MFLTIDSSFKECNLDLSGFYVWPAWSGKIDKPCVDRQAASTSSKSLAYELLISSFKLFDFDFSFFLILWVCFAFAFATRFLVDGEFVSFSFLSFS